MLGPQIAGGLLSSAPSVPKWNDITLGDEQKKAIEQNQASLPALQTLASGVNAFNQEQIQKMLRSAIPNYDAITQGVSNNITTLLRGEIPQDVQRQLETKAAGRALTGGYSGTGMHHNLTSRDLGLTSLSLIESGMNTAQNWLKTMDAMLQPNFFNVSSMFVTPGQQFQATFENQQARFSRDWLKSQVDNGYKWNNVVGAAIIKTDDQITNMMASVAGNAAGAAMCWVAREVYGPSNPQWIIFREWMLNEAPALLRMAYIRFGERVARFIRNKPRLKKIIRKWMDSKISK